MLQRKLTALSLVVAVTGLVACGDDAANEKPAPQDTQELAGSWKANVPLKEIPDLQSSPEMPLGPEWAIELVNDGAAPAMLRYSNKRGGVTGGYTYKVAGDRISVRDMNCSSGPARTVFSYTVANGMLTFKAIKNPCADHVFEDLLTARPWRRG